MSSYLSAQPVDDFGLSTPQVMAAVSLPASTGVSFTCPPTAPRYKAVFKYAANADVLVSYDGVSPTAPGAAFSLVNYELNPTCREVVAGEQITFFTATANTLVTVSLFSLNSPY